MPTRYDKQGQSEYSIASGYEGLDSGDLYVPPCTIEDVDRAIFNLFDKQIPLYYDDTLMRHLTVKVKQSTIFQVFYYIKQVNLFLGLLMKIMVSGKF